MSLLRIDDVGLEFGDQVIFRNADFSVGANERVCLIGRNGAGKTTLFRLITGEQTPDRGSVTLSTGLTVSQLDQSLPAEEDVTVTEVVSRGLEGVRTLRAEYERLSHATLDAAGLRDLEALQRHIDACNGWHIEQRVATFISELELPAERRMHELSGGWRRRVALAAALVSEPELLLLDEPTNHLDLVTIRWLEDRIRGYRGSVLFVTHDRAFLRSLATRIVEVDRGRLVSWPGDYDNFLRRRDEALEKESRDNARFDKKLAEEETWIRKGIKARRTRNEGRVRALLALREERGQRIARTRSAHIHIDQAQGSGRKVLRLHNVSHGFGDKKVIRDLNLKIMRGDRIGLVGNNGVGKSTLLRIMLGEIEPQTGTVKHGTNLTIGHYDPLRQDLALDKSVAFNVGDGRDHIDINGKSHHVVGYLKGFLFTSKRALGPVRSLSGGERNRLLLARMFTQASNLLVLDEPTNDLDIETLDVLEQKLIEYQGTLLVASHDRQFLDNVVTSILAFEADGQIREYVGGYSDWERKGRALAEVERPAGDDAERSREATRARRSATKLSYNEQRELDALPAAIEELEDKIAGLNDEIAAPDFYEQPFDDTQPTLTALADSNAELDAMSERWLALEQKREELAGG